MLEVVDGQWVIVTPILYPYRKRGAMCHISTHDLQSRLHPGNFLCGMMCQCARFDIAIFGEGGHWAVTHIRTGRRIDALKKRYRYN